MGIWLDDGNCEDSQVVEKGNDQKPIPPAAVRRGQRTLRGLLIFTGSGGIPYEKPNHF